MIKNNNLDELVGVILNIEDKEQLKQFLHDILTPAELRDVIRRWRIIKLLNKGLTQREIAKQLGVSISKVTRGSRVLQGDNIVEKLVKNK